jgi:hypothetical protein
MEDVAHINDVRVNPSASLALELLHRSGGAVPLFPSQRAFERSIGGMQCSQALLRLFAQTTFGVSCNMATRNSKLPSVCILRLSRSGVADLCVTGFD